MNERRLIIIIDGTGCSATYGNRGEFTNAFRIASVLKTVGLRNKQQIVLYFPGPGTRNVPWKEINKATGAETREIVLEAYLSLCCNVTHSNVDKIYLFGFSRGGVAAKALAEIILVCGILRKDSLNFLQSVWEYYVNRSDRVQSLFVTRVSRPSIEFVGLFDPVHGPISPYLDLHLRKRFPSRITAAVELFSIDENRKDFAPHVWIEDSTNLTITTKPKGTLSTPERKLQQIWLPGGHSDVGSLDSHSLISDIAFLTMIERASALTRLEFDLKNINNVVEQMGDPYRRILVKSAGTFWKKKVRTIPADTIQEVHPLFDKLLGQKVGQSAKESKTYEPLAVCDWSNDRYIFDLSGLGVQGAAQINVKIDEAINNALSGL